MPSLWYFNDVEDVKPAHAPVYSWFYLCSTSSRSSSSTGNSNWHWTRAQMISTCPISFRRVHSITHILSLFFYSVYFPLFLAVLLVIVVFFCVFFFFIRLFLRSFVHSLDFCASFLFFTMCVLLRLSYSLSGSTLLSIDVIHYFRNFSFGVFFTNPRCFLLLLLLLWLFRLNLFADIVYCVGCCFHCFN